MEEKTMNFDALNARLTAIGQQHVLRYWNDLDDAGKQQRQSEKDHRFRHAALIEIFYYFICHVLFSEIKTASKFILHKITLFRIKINSHQQRFSFKESKWWRR